jgi:tetratricopeptide (TPR) repeat protein
MFCCWKSKKKDLEARKSRSHPYLVSHHSEGSPIRPVALNEPQIGPSHLLKTPSQKIYSNKQPVKPEDYFKVSEDLYAESEKERSNNNIMKWLKIMNTLSSPKYTGEFKRYTLTPKFPNSKCLRELSDFHYRSKNYSEAKLTAEIALTDTETPKPEWYHNLIGLCNLKCNEIPIAIQEFKDAITINPGFHESHNNLGNLYMKTNCVEMAISHYEKARTGATILNQGVLTNNLVKTFQTKKNRQ